MVLLSFRVDISDTLMYVYEMLGAELLSSLYDKLGRLLTNSDQPSSWQVRVEFFCSQMTAVTSEPLGLGRKQCRRSNGINWYYEIFHHFSSLSSI